MQLSSKGRYAVMAMADLAHEACQSDVSQPIALAFISERQAISQAYLEQIFMKLRRAGLVKSSRGPGGGYVLAKEAVDISILEIMEAVEEPVQMTRCSLSDVGGCVAGHRCLTHGLWQDLGTQIKSFLDQTTLSHVVAQAAEFNERLQVLEVFSDEPASIASLTEGDA